MTDFERQSYLRLQKREFRCSDKLWDQIEQVTNGTISKSTFIRRAIQKEIKRWEENGEYE